jgi:hypothetical protein
MYKYEPVVVGECAEEVDLAVHVGPVGPDVVNGVPGRNLTTLAQALKNLDPAAHDMLAQPTHVADEIRVSHDPAVGPLSIVGMEVSRQGRFQWMPVLVAEADLGQCGGDESRQVAPDGVGVVGVVRHSAPSNRWFGHLVTVSRPC